MDDSQALDALLELSRIFSSNNQCQLAGEKLPLKFPLLDNTVVESAIESVAYILKTKPEFGIPCTNLMRKWCDVRDIGVSCRHVLYTGMDSSLANVDCLLAACGALVDKNSASNLLSLGIKQQQALCLAVTRLADKSEKARKLTVELFEMIIDQPELTIIHLEFLTLIWKLRELLELSTRDVENLVIKCPAGLEKELLSYVTNYIQREELDVYVFSQEETMSHLFTSCVSSPILFQVATSILLLLVQKSGAHQDIVEILTDFVQRCTKNEQSLLKLFPAKCQVALALLNVSPEETDCDSFVGYLIEALRKLPSSMATLLIILNCRWLPLVADRLKISSPF